MTVVGWPDTFAGIAPSCVPAFVGAQLVGTRAGAVILLALYPGVGRAAGKVVVT